MSWSDQLLGSMPNVYVYAANNPSESIVAKRRGYGTIISHNVPPYGRAGLYKQTAELRELLGEYREDPKTNFESLRRAHIRSRRCRGPRRGLPIHRGGWRLGGDNG